MSAEPLDSPTQDHPVRDPGAARRAEVYSGLAVLFSFPDRDNLAGRTLVQWLDELHAAIVQSPIDVPLDHLTAALEPVRNPAGAGEHYSALFDVAGGLPQVSLLERRYCDDPDQSLWEKLLRFYEYFGLNFSDGYAKEQPDHLVTQLSFMHYLCFLQATTSGDPAGLRKGQFDFVDLHLLPLANGIADRANSITEENAYRPLCTLLSTIVDTDHRLLRDVTTQAR